jgi:undecaprenyl-diphosphatase
MGADEALLRVLRTRGHQRTLEAAVRAYTRLGEHGLGWVAIGAAGAALDENRRPEWLRAAGAVAGAFLANQAVKLVVRRPRPRLADLPPLISTISNRSYPSAHATTSAAAAVRLGRLLPAAPIWVAAVAMALTRPYLGVHYPSDTAAGFVLGVAVAELAP